MYSGIYPPAPFRGHQAGRNAFAVCSIAVCAALASCYLQYGSMCNFGKLVALQLQLCSLQLACCCIAVLLLTACNSVVCCWYPRINILPSNRCVASDLWAPYGQPASSHMQRILPYAAYAAPVQPNAAHRQLNAPPQMSHISPYATLWPTKQHHMQRFLQYAAYAAPLQPNAAHRQPNPPPSETQ